jgi:hypothetical protein
VRKAATMAGFVKAATGAAFAVVSSTPHDGTSPVRRDTATDAPVPCRVGRARWVGGA